MYARDNTNQTFFVIFKVYHYAIFFSLLAVAMKKQAVVSILLFVAVIATNYLANALPINGMNTGEISALYPNLFVPDGLTFAIWGVIYLLLAVYVAYQTWLAFKSRADEQPVRAIKKINPLFWITCLLNIGWILLWHHLQISASLIVMLLFLVTLTRIFLITNSFRPRLRMLRRFLIVLPFTIYFAWICVATVANATALLVSLQLRPFGWIPEIWAIAMICIVALLTFFIVLVHDAAAFALVIAWACWGIYRNQYGLNTTVAYAAAGVAIAVMLIAAYRWIFPRRVLEKII